MTPAQKFLMEKANAALGQLYGLVPEANHAKAEGAMQTLTDFMVAADEAMRRLERVENVLYHGNLQFDRLSERIKEREGV
jgi:hypothetical protein